MATPHKVFLAKAILYADEARMQLVVMRESERLTREVVRLARSSLSEAEQEIQNADDVLADGVEKCPH